MKRLMLALAALAMVMTTVALPSVADGDSLHRIVSQTVECS